LQQKAFAQVMKFFLLVIQFLIAQFVAAQAKHIRVPFEFNDTSDQYQWMRVNIEQVGLEDLRSCRHAVHFRFWLESQAIEIWSKDENFFEGRLLNLASNVNQAFPHKKDTGIKIYTEFIPIDTASAWQIYQHLYQLKLFQVPFQDSLKDVPIINDAIVIYVEHSTPERYTFKMYDAVGYYDKLLPVQETYKYLFKKLSLEEIWNRYVQTLPKGCYHRVGIMLSCKDAKPDY
jgi:hypothetical protein